MHAIQTREVKKLPPLRGRTVVNLFFEDSTRTRSSFEIAGKWLSADVINVSAKGSSVSKGEIAARHRAHRRGDGRRRARRAPSRVRRGASARRLGRLPRRQRRRRHPRAPDPGAARRVHAARSHQRLRRPAHRHRRRHHAQPGGPQQRAAAEHPRCARHARGAAHPHAQRGRVVAVRDELGSGRDAVGQVARRRRCGDDAARAARAHVGRLLPDRARVRHRATGCRRRGSTSSATTSRSCIPAR